MNIMTVPWLLCAITALWFGWQARRVGRDWALWGLGGGIFGLVTATIVVGIGESSCNPFSAAERTRFHLEWTATAVALIAMGGWLLTMDLHRHHGTLLRLIRGKKAPTTTPGTSLSQPKTSG